MVTANLALVFGIAGTTALLTGVFWAAALHREREAHDATRRERDRAERAWSQAHIAHVEALADLSRNGINGAIRRHPANGRHLRAVR